MPLAKMSFQNDTQYTRYNINYHKTNPELLQMKMIIIISSGFANETPIRSSEAPYKVKYRLNSTTKR